MLWQTRSLIMPANPGTIPINIVYMIFTSLIWFLLYRSYKPNATMSTTVYPAYIIFVIRQLARIVEIAKFDYDVDFVSTMVLSGTIFYTFYMTVFMFSFYNLRGSYVIFFVICITASMASKYAFDKSFKTSKSLLNPTLLFMILVATSFTYYFNQVTDKEIR